MAIEVFYARKDALYAAGGVVNDALYDVLGFAVGTVNPLGNHLALGALPRCNLLHNAFMRGQQLGDGLSIALGAAELIIGEGMRGGGEVMMVTSFGTLVPVATALETAGTAISTHGVVGKALME